MELEINVRNVIHISYLPNEYSLTHFLKKKCIYYTGRFIIHANYLT
jgi:ribosomal protein L32